MATTITKEKTAEIIAKYGKNASDSGDVRSQIVILTERINNLTKHSNEMPKDNSAKNGMKHKLVPRRNRLLKYLRRCDLEGYRALVKELNLRGGN